MIGDDVEVTVLEVKGNTVKLGFNAPGNVPVHRSEVYVKVQRSKSSQENAVASQPLN
ncbi:MAG: carbon storage regulator [Marinosulfonomonas sp.]